ncbi:hypothetical protein AMAG_07608 [Allomyces macrogynus ATCC 38327]|uniref:ABC transporter domain-containing protein n=1 Tax=Allomyces macrogynus (strain ATCC 38327) TaxID=578462 RepID=A0A0L0SJ25_ALLM3|nr:hypothetical protein AMAG_07608 [Allomyces macrogynus ATCC 38327]|eukprot:KNE62385.1 hypothetical protein AMAG_07608 [Allomyces macrogynus ATCC 38327]
MSASVPLTRLPTASAAPTTPKPSTAADLGKRANDPPGNSTSTSSNSTTSLPPSASSCPVCPSCFTCASEGCLNFGQCKNGVCQCAPGLGGKDCSLATCNSTNVPADLRVPRPDRADCKCDDGFAGTHCNVCYTDAACSSTATVPTAERRDGEARICNRTPRVFKSAHLQCEVTSTEVKSLYPGQIDITMNRNLVSKSGLASLWIKKVLQFTCQFSQCTTTVEKPGTIDAADQWTCSSIQCKCIARTDMCGGGSSLDLTSALQAVTGPFVLACPLADSNGALVGTNASLAQVADKTVNGKTSRDWTNGSKCSFRLGGALDMLIPNGIKLENCMHGECAYPADAPADVLASASSSWSAGEIAGVSVVGALLVLVLALLALAFRQRAQYRARAIPKPARGLEYTFADVRYVLGDKVVLDRVAGTLPTGSLTAIMGPSGAGKSSLLDILAHKPKRGTVAARFELDGAQIEFGNKKLRHALGFVDQEDVLVPWLTVEEALWFVADMRLPEATPHAAKAAVIDQVLIDLNLAHIRTARIGGAGYFRGISGGERRRVSIAVELVTSPAILFLDEPTSGLDSHAAHKLLEILADLAHRQGKTIVCTIHQPRSDVYALFDRVMLLTRGRVLYHGPGDAAKDHFERQGHTCPLYYNVADFLLDMAVASEHRDQQLAAVGIEALNEPESPRTAKPLLDMHRDDSAMTALDADAALDSTATTTALNATPARTVSDASSSASSAILAMDSGYQVSYLTQVTKLLARNGKCLVRNPRLLIGHNVLAVILGVIIGLLYFQAPVTIAGLQNRIGSVFFLQALVAFAALSALGSLAEERLLFMRERGNACYKPSAFFMSKLVLDVVPLRIIPTLLMSTIAYFLIGFQASALHFLKFAGVMMLFSVVATLLCMACAAVLRDVATATLVSAMTTLFTMLLGGVLLNANALPPAARWLPYLSVFRYATEALAVNEVDGIVVHDTFNGVEVNLSGITIVDSIFGFRRGSYLRDLLVLVGMNVVLLVGVGALIVFKMREMR